MLSFCSCSIDSESCNFVDSENYYFSSRIWKTKSKEKSIILAIHGYNDYSNSFDSPANFLSKYQTSVFSFDLRGFGSNQNKGNWFPLEVHINDVEFYLKKIKKKFPDRKLFLLGESMGGAIVVSTLKRNPKISLDGVILVAPAIWNFSEKNPVKKTILEIASSFSKS